MTGPTSRFNAIGNSGSPKRVLDMCSVYSLAMGALLESEQHNFQGNARGLSTAVTAMYLTFS